MAFLLKISQLFVEHVNPHMQLVAWDLPRVRGTRKALLSTADPRIVVRLAGNRPAILPCPALKLHKLAALPRIAVTVLQLSVHLGLGARAVLGIARRPFLRPRAAQADKSDGSVDGRRPAVVEQAVLVHLAAMAGLGIALLPPLVGQGR